VLVALTELTTSPVPLATRDVAPVMKLAPVTVMGTVAPCRPEAMSNAVMAGASGAETVMVNVTPLLVPPGVVTVTERGPVVAAGPIRNVAVIVDAEDTTGDEMVIPVPLTVKVVAPITKFAPAIATSLVSP